MRKPVALSAQPFQEAPFGKQPPHLVEPNRKR
jgi:hypothetical protein